MFSQNINADFIRNAINIVKTFENIIKMEKNVTSKIKVFDGLLKYLSKAFGCLDYELLTAILNACNFNLPAYCLILEAFARRWCSVEKVF